MISPFTPPGTKVFYTGDPMENDLAPTDGAQVLAVARIDHVPEEYCLECGSQFFATIVEWGEDFDACLCAFRRAELPSCLIEALNVAPIRQDAEKVA